MSLKLDSSFYHRPDVVGVAKDLIGKKLCTHIDGSLTTGIITETEAYAGLTDKASHAYGGRFTERTKTMYATGGISYVYLCYGIHHLFNVVTYLESIPHAVLIRGIRPLEGIEMMLERRKAKKLKRLSDGPGKLSKALGIGKAQNAISLLQDEIWIEETDVIVPEQELLVGPRVGIDYAEEHKELPWRFLWKPNNS